MFCIEVLMDLNQIKIIYVCNLHTHQKNQSTRNEKKVAHKIAIFEFKQKKNCSHKTLTIGNRKHI